MCRLLDAEAFELVDGVEIASDTADIGPASLSDGLLVVTPMSVIRVARLIVTSRLGFSVGTAPTERRALNFFGPENTSTTSITLTLTIAPINCIEQEGTLESRCALDVSRHYLGMEQHPNVAQRLPQGLLERHLDGVRERHRVRHNANLTARLLHWTGVPTIRK